MKDDEYIRFCPEHGMMEDPVPVCGKCGQETLVSAMTYGQWQEYRASKEEPERFFPGTLEVAFKKPLEKIISDIRSGKKGRAEPSIKLLSWRPEREQYIADVIAWRDTLRGYAVPLFMSHCSYESIRPYLDFKDYISMDPYLVKVYWPYFLEHYKGRRPLACEECKSETNRLFIKIVSEKKEVSAVRRGGWVVRNFQFTAHPVPHALCDTCMLKKASKRKKLKGLSDEEKIQGFMNYNSDLNVHACGDTGEFGAFFNLNSAGGGFSYEYLLGPAAAEAVLVAQKRGDQNDVAVLSAMIECAGHVREELEQNP